MGEPSDRRPRADALPAAARALDLVVRVLKVRTRAEFEPAFAAAAREGLHGLHISQFPLFNSSRGEVTALPRGLACPLSTASASSRWRVA
jgi:hypothetical protein